MGRKEPPVPGGLRERKKASTQARLRSTALRLFRERGFAAVSVDQIADAAEVSRSTFFRYFGSKEAVLLEDLDESGDVFLTALASRPPEETPWRAFEEALVTTSIDASARRTVEEQRTVDELMRNDPALRGRRLQELTRWTDLIARAFALRGGRTDPDFEDRLAAATCMAVSEEVAQVWREDGGADPAELIRDAFETIRRY